MTVDTKVQYARMGARLIDHVKNGTTDWAADTMEVPSSSYTDPDQWQREMDQIFKSQPILVGISQEIPEAGDFKTLNMLGIPLLLTRQKDGSAKVLLNVCTHRGMQLMADNNWNSKFITEYMIKGIPRFILLDKDLNIISANAPRPSDEKLVTILNDLNL